MRCLFALSADFGEFVTASLMSRGQPFERLFALPPQLAAAAGDLPHAVYRRAEDISALAQSARADLVVLGSGYLFAINNLFGPDELAALVERLRASGVALASTDPWLRLRALRPQARFSIHSARRRGVDPAQSERIAALQRRLEAILGRLPHLLVVPAPLAEGVFNPKFASSFREETETETDTWLFVLGREDLAIAGDAFFEHLEARLRELLAVRKNRIRFIAPARVGEFLGRAFAGEPRIEHLPFCDFQRFESEVRGARIVAYWNALSASALYCLYHGVAPVFFGHGHQAAVLEGLLEHAVEHVYRGRPPVFLDLGVRLEPDASALLERHRIAGWLATLRADYEKLPDPSSVMERLCHR